MSRCCRQTGTSFRRCSTRFSILAREPGELLVTLSGGDRARRLTLERMVADCERDAPLLDQTAFERFDDLLDEPVTTLPAILSERYQVGRELGHGGMARVYLAHDRKHKRDVALKVIRPELAASLGREQFLREIAIAARLRHPNIVPLYDSGDDAGSLYFIMPFEAGPSLREKLHSGPLAIPDAVNVLRDVARALAYAHEQGIVHRDVKPDNVMLSSGSAVVTDFGIAKAVRAAQTENAAFSLVQTGVFGTPAYMAPEQAAHETISDHRADIYSFGCTAYELLCGRPPFEGDSADDLIAAHAASVPQSLSVLRPEIPPELVKLVSRCLEKRPEARPQNAAELAEALDSVAAPTAKPKQRRRTRTVAAASLLTVASLALGGYYVVSSRDSIASTSTAAGPVTVAVLPLRSIGGDSTHALFVDGLGDEIASALVKMPWLRVMSRRGVSNYRGRTDIDYRQAGRDLGARYLLTGSARERDGREVVMLQLINAADGGTLWADRFDHSSTQLEAQRDAMVRSIADALQPLAPQSLRAGRPATVAKRTTSGEAYFYQVQAQQWLDRRGQSVESSAEYFRRAIAVDPNSARAYSGLSLSLALFPYFQNTPSREVRNDVARAANRALQLDPTLAQPHVALGMAYENDRQWERAGVEFTTAIRLDSHDVEARVQYGRYLLFLGRTEEGLAQFQAAREDDPASALVLSWIAYSYYLQRNQDSARVLSQRALQSNARNLTSVTFGSLIMVADGRLDEAKKLIAYAVPDWPSTLFVTAVTGNPEAVRLRVSALSRERPTPWMLHTTEAFAMLGLRDTARALDALELATTQGEIWPTLNPPTDRIFDPVRESPRFRKLLAKVGLGDIAKSIPAITSH